MSKKNSTFKFRVHYHQVDQMGIVHHAQYAYFLEQARIEWLSNRGIRYASLEKDGILLPLTDISIQYKHSLYFDDVFFVHVFLDKMERFFVSFSYHIENESGALIAKASTRLVFVDATTRKAISCPEVLLPVFRGE